MDEGSEYATASTNASSCSRSRHGYGTGRRDICPSGSARRLLADLQVPAIGVQNVIAIVVVDASLIPPRIQAARL